MDPRFECVHVFCVDIHYHSDVQRGKAKNRRRAHQWRRPSVQVQAGICQKRFFDILFQRFSNSLLLTHTTMKHAPIGKTFDTWLNESPALTFTKAFQHKFSPIDLFRKLPWLIIDTRFRCDTRTCGKMTFGVPFFLSTLVFRTIALMVLITFLQMWTGVILFMLFFFNLLTSLSVGDDFSR